VAVLAANSSGRSSDVTEIEINPIGGSSSTMVLLLLLLLLLHVRVHG
jgi:hypothetical protein